MFYERDLCVFVVLYVDDLLITRSHEAKVIELEQRLEGEIEMSKLGLLTYYIDIEFVYMAEGALLVQRNYIQNLLRKFNMLDCDAVTTLWKRAFNSAQTWEQTMWTLTYSC